MSLNGLFSYITPTPRNNNTAAANTAPERNHPVNSRRHRSQVLGQLQRGRHEARREIETESERVVHLANQLRETAGV